ncbi:hypothetical protein CASFOL_027200 [Castilleja foliolosa]|uniref:Uncharacterized protein n=1 Tax=Castilleja foliolosa TaxID=1961234 RepID=A0ABD3CF27_9LAMI
MSDDDRKLSKLGFAMIIIFAISLLLLFIQLFWALWRRRVLRRQIKAGVGGECVDHRSIYSSPDSNFSSKDLVNFYRLRSQSNRNFPNLDQELHKEAIDIDLLMLRGRFLFTIKEDEREECGSPEDDRSRLFGEVKSNSWVDLAGQLKAAEGTVVEMEVGDGRHDDTASFSTASSSPRYFTPDASPNFGVAGGRGQKETVIGFQK